MLKALDTTATMYEPGKASDFVSLLNSTEDGCGWTYAVDCPTGARYARIKVTDEDGAFVGYL